MLLSRFINGLDDEKEAPSVDYSVTGTLGSRTSVQKFLEKLKKWAIKFKKRKYYVFHL